MRNKKILALVGEDAPEDIIASLTTEGFEACKLPHCEQLAAPVASHADMLFLKVNDKIFCPRKYIKEKKELRKTISSYGYKIVPCRTQLTDKYPDDIAFNFAIVGARIYGRTDKMSKRMAKHLQKIGFELIKVKQGYAKCSTVILGEDAAITADRHIEKAMRADGTKVLKIENSSEAVRLDGYNYGFLGGACGVCFDTVYFSGNIDLHPNSEEIKLFCSKQQFNIVSLSQNQLTDVGGIIFLPDIS